MRRGGYGRYGRDNRYEHRPLTAEEHDELKAAMARYQEAVACWSGWLFGKTTGTPEARHAAWLEASQASHAAEAILRRIKAAHLRKPGMPASVDDKGHDRGHDDG